MNPSLLVVLTTFDDEACAREVARQLVDERLVACAQVETAPIFSVWRWEGAVESGPEWRLTLKLDPGCLDRLDSRLHELHPAQTPQFVVLGATASEGYSRWVRESCS